MHRIIAYLLSLLLIASSVSSLAETPPEKSAEYLEKALQQLPWPEFRAVVEAIPKLRAGVEAYGPLGWKFVEANYSNYGWKKKIDRLDAEQKDKLAELIANAHKKIPAMSGSGD